MEVYNEMSSISFQNNSTFCDIVQSRSPNSSVRETSFSTVFLTIWKLVYNVFRYFTKVEMNHFDWWKMFRFRRLIQISPNVNT